MKSVKLSLLLVGILFITSCGSEPPRFNESDPFIVGKIEQRTETHSMYYNNVLSMSGESILGDWRQKVVLPTGMFNIGDTIIFKK